MPRVIGREDPDQCAARKVVGNKVGIGKGHALPRTGCHKRQMGLPEPRCGRLCRSCCNALNRQPLRPFLAPALVYQGKFENVGATPQGICLLAEQCGRGDRKNVGPDQQFGSD